MREKSDVQKWIHPRKEKTKRKTIQTKWFAIDFNVFLLTALDDFVITGSEVINCYTQKENRWLKKFTHSRTEKTAKALWISSSRCPNLRRRKIIRKSRKTIKLAYAHAANDLWSIDVEWIKLKYAVNKEEEEEKAENNSIIHILKSRAKKKCSFILFLWFALLLWHSYSFCYGMYSSWCGSCPAPDMAWKVWFGFILFSNVAEIVTSRRMKNWTNRQTGTHNRF